MGSGTFQLGVPATWHQRFCRTLSVVVNVLTQELICTKGWEEIRHANQDVESRRWWKTKNGNKRKPKEEETIQKGKESNTQTQRTRKDTKPKKKSKPKMWETSTGWLDRMLLRKWRETKQQTSRARSGHQISCCLVSLRYLCDILSGHPVQ